jgi:hypothetical protein
MPPARRDRRTGFRVKSTHLLCYSVAARAPRRAAAVRAVSNLVEEEQDE